MFGYVEVRRGKVLSTSKVLMCNWMKNWSSQGISDPFWCVPEPRVFSIWKRNVTKGFALISQTQHYHPPSSISQLPS